MAVRLTLIASGATAAHRRAAFPLDEPLEATQAAKAGALGKVLKASRRVFVAPALRARQTLDALGFAGAVVDRRLDDWNAGRWAGRTLAELGDEEPEALRSWMRDPAAVPHGGESLLALFARVGGWLEERLGDTGRVLAVSHPAVLRAAVATVLQAPPESFWRIDAEPLCRLDLSGDGRRWNLRLRA